MDDVGFYGVLLMKVRQSKPPDYIASVFDRKAKDEDWWELGGLVWGARAECRTFKGWVWSGFVWSNVNGLLLGGQQAVHRCRHCLHMDLRQKRNKYLEWNHCRKQLFWQKMTEVTVESFYFWCQLHKNRMGTFRNTVTEIECLDASRKCCSVETDFCLISNCINSRIYFHFSEQIQHKRPKLFFPALSMAAQREIQNFFFFI